MPQGNASQTYADTLPRRHLRVLSQCKAEEKKPGPNRARKFKGVWVTRAALYIILLTAYAPLHEQSFEEHPHRFVALWIFERPFTKSSLCSILITVPGSSTAPPPLIGVAYPNPPLVQPIALAPLEIRWKSSNWLIMAFVRDGIRGARAIWPLVGRSKNR
ncbi:hypothetical protein BKA82DRAFT_25698 [Pisolithus tinctorius]|uniref:Uncharacterized protein n=1 Tax=Pisolithus tinctorius Marx 270 TaxID=870435 RepID=A0A0C3J7Q1_PISTI|nr:hypothetical protein BKA82DRAFT_25698 [Pisolithus tinctorius]KIO05078.1 hypothetical protein M404DRAFT_25698 [Pisolithus tinctorius Marx 270]